MKRSAVILASATLVLALTNVAYAVKPVDAGTKSNKPETVVEMLANKVKGYAKARNAVRKPYFYEQAVIDAAAEGEGWAEYTAWGKGVYTSKKGMLVLNARGLTADASYNLQYNGETVATGTANEDGDLHIKEYLTDIPVEAWDEPANFTLVPAEGAEGAEGDVTLVGYNGKVKRVVTETEEDME